MDGRYADSVVWTLSKPQTLLPCRRSPAVAGSDNGEFSVRLGIHGHGITNFVFVFFRGGKEKERL